jgi:hypothetical protein
MDLRTLMVVKTSAIKRRNNSLYEPSRLLSQKIIDPLL